MKVILEIEIPDNGLKRYIQELQREQSMRDKVYPGQVYSGKLTAFERQTRDHLFKGVIEIMAKIELAYQDKTKEPSLFD